VEFLGLTRKELENHIKEILPQERYDTRSQALYQMFYKNKLLQISDIVVGEKYMNLLKKHLYFEPTGKIILTQKGEDTSLKFLTQFPDGHSVESVLVPEKHRLTLCLSTQIGCKQACTFCQTGRMGFIRHLKTHEIIEQYWFAEILRKKMQEEGIYLQYKNISNIVFMGMGEPLDNLNHVLNSLEILTDPQGPNIGQRKITVSTVGILPQLEELIQKTKVSIALSLHYPFEEERSLHMPCNQKHSLSQIIHILEKYKEKTFFIQYVLIKGLNDTLSHAQKLASLLENVSCKINLIPLNECSSSSLERPDLEHIFIFQKELKEKGFVVTIRFSKGQDIDAACGQLLHEQLKNK